MTYFLKKKHHNNFYCVKMNKVIIFKERMVLFWKQI